MYLNGKSVPQNHKEAEAWLQKAAKQGDPVAQFKLGADVRQR